MQKAYTEYVGVILEIGGQLGLFDIEAEITYSEQPPNYAVDDSDIDFYGWFEVDRVDIIRVWGENGPLTEYDPKPFEDWVEDTFISEHKGF